jgi:hypothetical protein
MDPGYSVHIVETVTGKVVCNDLAYLDTPQFLRQLNDDGNIRVTIPIGDASVPDNIRALTAAWRYSLAICIGSSILAYGPIMTHQFDEDNSNLSLGAGSMWALFSRRWLINPSATISSPLSMDPSQDANYTGLSLWDIVREIVEDSLSRGASYALPIDLPALGAASTHERNYPIYDLANLTQRLKDLTQVEGGPDVDWDPYFSDSGHVRIRLRIGQPILTQVGLDLRWDHGSSLTYVNVDSNSSHMTTSVLVRGNATERASKVAYATDTTLAGLGWPVLEATDTSHQSVTEIDTLQSYADEWIRFYATPVEVWSAEVVTDVAPLVGTYKPGDMATFNIQNHPWIMPGSYQNRILGWTQAGPNRLNLILEAVEGVI